jgi:dTDP-4-amino-4,6-dideoxygalactose transaminase
MEWRVPLADFRIAEDDLAAVVATYQSGWLTMGPRTAEFERLFVDYTGAADAIAVSSGTAALHLVCLTAGLGPGDDVIVPSLTFVATVNAIAYTGARPVFADVAAVDQPWLSAGACERVITERTRAVLTVAYGGHCGEIEALVPMCEEHGLLLLEDTAHAAGSRLHGRHLGTHGVASAFSMFSNKNLAVGEGGVVLTSDEAFAAQVRLLRSHGLTTMTWDRHRGHATDYDVVALGYNYRIDEPRAALAASRLARLDADNARRARIDAMYREQFAGLDLTGALPAVDGLESSHHLFVIVLPERSDRGAFRRYLAEEGIQSSVHYPPVHQMTMYAGEHDLPVTESYAARAVTLPMFAGMTDTQVEAVVVATKTARARLRSLR